jgi:hypothetical protein
MKISPIILGAFLLAGCASYHPGARLPAEQARMIAMQLANVKAYALYHCQPFVDDQPAHFTSGHWTWGQLKGYGHGDLLATVELAADGSTNSVDVQLLASRTSPLPP